MCVCVCSFTVSCEMTFNCDINKICASKFCIISTHWLLIKFVLYVGLHSVWLTVF